MANNLKQVLLVVGPSASGKSTIRAQLQERGIAAVDLDLVANVPAPDGVGNFYDMVEVLSTALRHLATHDEVVLFGLSRNITTVIHQLRSRGAKTALLSVDVDTLIARRLGRGKPFDLSLDSRGHRRDIGRFHDLVTPHLRFKVRTADDVIELLRAPSER